MKIIKKGTKITPEEIVYIKKCTTCGCLFTYKIDDYHYSYYRECNVLFCPQCHYVCLVPLFKRKYKGEKE